MPSLPDHASFSRSSLVAAASVAALLAVARSAAFVLWPHAAFDADQALVGLMAKHVSEARAFPVTFYGQNYLLAVEAYLAAPLFAVFGASVTLLKLPLLAINAAVAALLVLILVRDGHLRPWTALAATVFFAVCSPIAGAHLVAAMGGSVEPYLYVLLIWVTRRHPVLCGAVAGLGFMHREFSVFGLAALFAVELLRDREAWRPFVGRAMATVVSFACVVALANAAIWWGDFWGPGLPHVDVNARTSSFAAATSRSECAIADEVGPNIAWLVGNNLPMLAGTLGHDRDMFYVGAPSAAAPFVWWTLTLWLLVACVRAAAEAWSRHRTGQSPGPSPAFPAFLGIVGVLTLVAFSGSCDVRGPMLVRYTLLALLIPVAVAAWHLQVERRAGFRYLTLVMLAGWALWSGARSGAVVVEYVQHAPETTRSRLATELERRGITRGRTDYWTAHPVTFLTGERVRLASEPPRILLYEIELSHVSPILSIEREPCPGGIEIERQWVCR